MVSPGEIHESDLPIFEMIKKSLEGYDPNKKIVPEHNLYRVDPITGKMYGPEKGTDANNDRSTG